MRVICKYIGESTNVLKKNTLCEITMSLEVYHSYISVAVYDISWHHDYANFQNFINNWEPIRYIDGDFRYPFNIIHDDVKYVNIKDLIISIIRDKKIGEII
jgi:hypothetical protein